MCRLAVTAFAARRLNVSQTERRAEVPKSDNNLKVIFKNAVMRNETILHIVLKFQVDRDCFHGGEASANLSEKVQQDEKRGGKA